MKMKHLSEEDQRRLREAMTAVERRTSAHFAVVVTPLSDRYSLFPLVWAAAGAFVVGGVMATFWPLLPLRAGFLIEAGTLTALALILDWVPLRLLVVPRRWKHEHCVGFARREFAAHILADREHRPGMLLFLSLGERHVEILADGALHVRVGGDAWNRVVAEFVAGPKTNAAFVDGLVLSIEACGSMLEKHYPRAADDPSKMASA